MATVKQMYDFLRIAAQMEENVYTNKQILLKLQNRINELNSIPYYTEKDYRTDQLERTVYARKRKKIPRIVIALIIFFSIGTVPMILLYLLPIIFGEFNGTSRSEASELMMYILASLGILVILFVAIRIIKKKNTKRNVRMSEIKSQTLLTQSNNEREKNQIILANYQKQFNDMKTITINSMNSLDKLYSENILPQQYRNIVAVTTMLQWLSSGRCTEIYGHGGLFDTYENDLKMNMIIGRLDEISSKLDAIMENQNMLYNEIRRGNEIAEKTYQSVRQIENNTDQMKRDISQINTNSAIIARNSAQQTWMQQYAYYQSLYH